MSFFRLKDHFNRPAFMASTAIAALSAILSQILLETPPNILWPSAMAVTGYLAVTCFSELERAFHRIVGEAHELIIDTRPSKKALHQELQTKIKAGLGLGVILCGAYTSYVITWPTNPEVTGMFNTPEGLTKLLLYSTTLASASTLQSALNLRRAFMLFSGQWEIAHRSQISQTTNEPANPPAP